MRSWLSWLRKPEKSNLFIRFSTLKVAILSDMAASYACPPVETQAAAGRAGRRHIMVKERFRSCGVHPAEGHLLPTDRDSVGVGPKDSSFRRLKCFPNFRPWRDRA